MGQVGVINYLAQAGKADSRCLPFLFLGSRRQTSISPWRDEDVADRMGADDVRADRGPGSRGDEDAVVAGKLDCGHRLRDGEAHLRGGEAHLRGREVGQGHRCLDGRVPAEESRSLRDGQGPNPLDVANLRQRDDEAKPSHLLRGQWRSHHR